MEFFRFWKKRGYVFLPIKDKDTGKWIEGKAYLYPDEKEKITQFIKSTDNNLYWSLNQFKKPRRSKGLVIRPSILYADLDEADINQLPLNPSMLWETSPHRHSAVWDLEEDLSSTDFEAYNKGLTYKSNADKSGYDITQVLRVPGKRNYKYEGGPRGRIIHNLKITYPIDKIKIYRYDEPLTVQTTNEDILFNSDTDDLLNIVVNYMDKIPKRTLQLLLTPSDKVTDDRSKALFNLECRLVESGLSDEEIINIISSTHWNKYRGRHDEDIRLISEIAKARTKIGTNIVGMKKWEKADYFLSSSLEEPGWLIKNFWQRGSHGFICGEPKTYKSVISTDIMISVASGTPFLGHYKVETKGPVLYVQEENAPWLVQDRMLKVGMSRGLLGNCDKEDMTVNFSNSLPIHLLNNQGLSLQNEDDKEFLIKSIEKIKPVLLVIDPLYLVLGDVDEKQANELKPMLQWLLQIRYKYNVAIMLLHHMKKGNADRAGQRMHGSTFLHAWVESAIYTKILDEIDHTIIVEREFRSFNKPSNITIKWDMGDPMDYDYSPKVMEFDYTSIALICDFITLNPGADMKSLVENFDDINVKAILKQALLANKISSKGNKYYIKGE